MEKCIKKIILKYIFSFVVLVRGCSISSFFSVLFLGTGYFLFSILLLKSYPAFHIVFPVMNSPESC